MLHPDRVRQVGWSGEKVGLDEILEQLNHLRAEFAARSAGDFELPHPRNSVMNLVALAPTDGASDRAAGVAQALGIQHPSRTIVVQPTLQAGDRVDAAIKAYAHELVDGAPIQYEEIRLRVWGTRARVRSLVEPLLAPDVQTHLWWLGTPPWEADAFREILPDVNTLVVDSSQFDRPYEGFLALAHIAEHLEPYQGVADFEWVRLRAWREALSQVFAPTRRASLLPGISAVGIDYAGEGRANRGCAALTAGWLIDRLGWELVHATAGPGGVLQAHYRAPAGHAVEIAARSVEDVRDTPDGMLLALRVEGAAHDQTLRAELARDREDLNRARLILEVGGEEPLQHDVPLGDPEDTAVLSKLLVTGRRDPVYLRSLRSAGELLRALS